MANESTLRAVVREGRLTLDEPTDLPEGQVVELVRADPYTHLDGTVEIDEEERARLDDAIESAWRDHQAGAHTHSAQDVIARLRAKA